VVDDEPTIRGLVADALSEAGYFVSTAANGAEALNQMRAQTPHAIVLDLMMPVLDADGFVARMRADTSLARVPIVVLTAAYGAHEAAVRLGASACLTKPFELDYLVQSVAKVVGDAVAA
jgi:CheY-like chemotaxis protein